MNLRRICEFVGTGVILLLLTACGGGGLYGGGSSSGSGQIASINIAPGTASITANGTQQYTVTAKDSNGNMVNGVNFTWTSSNNAIVTVSNTGMATGLMAGTANVTAAVTYGSTGGGCSGPYCTPGSGGMANTITSNPATLTVTAAGMVMGTAAVGHAFAGALVSLKDSTGQLQVATTDAQGRFQLAVSGMQAPYILKLTDNLGHVMFGLGNAAGVINIDPFSDVIARLWYQAHGSSVEAAFTNPRGQAVPDDASLKTLDGALVELLSNAITVQGLDPATLSVLHMPFTADGTGLDGLLDHTSVSMNNGSMVLSNSLAGGQAISMNTTALTVMFRATSSMNSGMLNTNMTGMGMMNPQMTNMDTMASPRTTELIIHLTH